MSKTVRISSVDVAYEVVGEGIPLALLHLFFDNSEFWLHSGYVDAFRRAGRQLILIDASGHGQSSKPHDKAAYGLRPRASEVVAVLDALQIEKSEVLGYSMGGWTALGLVSYYPGRLRSAAIGGIPPYAQDLQPLRDVVAKGPVAWVDFLGSRATDGLPRDMQRRVLRNDQLALAASVEEDRPDISEQVASAAVPLLFFIGDRDPSHERCKEFAERTGSRFVSIAGAHHVQTLLERDKVVPEVVSFFDEYNQSEPA